MLCPRCKKQETSIADKKQDIKSNLVLRNRYCPKCDFTFSTNEKIKIIKKRKPRPEKLLMNFRFYLYGMYRIAAILDTEYKLIKSQGGRDKAKFDVIRWVQTSSGKSKVILADVKYKNNKKIFNTSVERYLERKKETIEHILSFDCYWLYKNSIINKDQLDKKEIYIICSKINKLGLKKWNKQLKNENEIQKRLWNKTWNELENFHKSISSYIKKKDEEYNRNFFINYRIDKKFSPWDEKEQGSISDYWKEDHNWARYITSR